MTRGRHDLSDGATRVGLARRERHRRTRRRAWSLIAGAALALPIALVPALSASAATWGISKTELSTGPYEPGQQIQWVVTISCSDPNADPCTNAVLTDPLPENIDLVSASIQSGPAGGTLDADTETNTVTYTNPTVPNGAQAQILITAQVDPDIPYSANGVPITNTATVVADNAPETSASDDVVPVVELILGSETTKTIEPEGALAAPGTPATMTIGSTNTSNDPVDTLVIQDPVDPTADPNPFTYLQYTSTGDITMPPNATTVTQEYWDGDSWEPLDDSVDPAAVQGVRYTFSGDIQPGATATIPVNVEQSDAVEDLTDPTTITNDTSSFVTHAEGQSDPTTASDTYVITPPNTSVEASKSFDPATVGAGDPTTVTIGGTNTGTPVDSMTITEPSPGTPSPFEGDDPLTFTGFGPTGDGTGVQWPNGANGASVTFTCADGSTPTEDATAPNTLPNPPAGCVVVGFSVTFTGDLPNGAAASIPFTADTDPDQAPEDVTHTNQITADVPNATDTATADLVTLTDRLATDTQKSIAPSEIPSVPGQAVIVQLPTELLPFGPDGSTTNAAQVVVSDPTDPANPGDFWDHFTATSVRTTDVPANSTLTINYWNGSEWVPAPDCGNPIAGPATVSCDLPPDAQGVQFVYDSTGGGFPPGTQFQPNFVAEFTGPSGFDDVLTNCGASSASSSTVPPTEPAEGCDTVDPFPVDGDGPGDFIEKTFLGEQPVSVLARSDGQVTAQITWSTGGFTGVDPMVISDINDPEGTAIADSFYDAFDLVSVDPIDASVDPLIAYDQIESVELFIDGAWVEASGDPCPEACDGTFPGYTLTADEQESATSVRLTYTESPSRTTDDPLAPQPGDGVARSTQADGRHLNLTFQVRDYKRSDGSPALGNLNGVFYNTDDPGLVNDTARGTATFDGQEFTADDDDNVLIIDQPLNVTVDKEWTGGPISVPPADTPDEFYPHTTVTITGTNASAAKVDQLRLADPTAPGSGDVVTADGTQPFDAFTLTAIAVTPPAGAETTTVTLHYDDDTTATFDEAEAEALTPADLVDVVGVEVSFDGLVLPSASGSMDLTLQLRELDRYTGLPVTVADSPVPNGAAATIADPGGTDGDVRLANDDATMVLQDAAIAIEVGKTFAPDTVVEPNHGQGGADDAPVVMTLSGQPLGPSRAVEMVIVDDDPQFWNSYDFVGFAGAVLSAPIQQVQIDAFVGGEFIGDPGSPDPVTVTGGDWVEGTPLATFTLPDGVAPEDVQGLRFTFSRADGSIWENPATPTQLIPIEILRRDEMRSGGPVLPDLAANPPGPGETAPGVTSNSVQGTVTGADLVVDPDTGDLVPVSADDDAAAQILYAHAVNGVQIVKDFNGTVTGGTAPPNSVIAMNIAVTNTGDRPIVDPVVIDDPMPTDADGAQLTLADVDEPFSYVLSGEADPDPSTPDLPTDAADVTVDQTGDIDALQFAFPPGSVLEVGQTYTITVQVMFRVGLTAGTLVANTAGVTGDRPWDECVTRLDPETGACEADADITPIGAAVLAQSKLVKATNDDELDVMVDPAAPNQDVECLPNADGFYAYPCTPVIAPGHNETWQVRVDNVGNLPMDKLVIYDRLPAIGDTGSFADSPRGSQWSAIPTLDPLPQMVNAPPGAVVGFYYTTSDDYCMDDINDPINEPVCPTDDPVAGWAPVTGNESPEFFATITALKVVITFPDDALFQPGEFVAVEGTTTTPPVAPEAGDRSIAWNSAAASGVVLTPQGEFNLLPTEGVKVGVATATGSLQVDKMVTGPGADFAPDTFALNVQCTSAVGTWVETVLDPIPITVTPGEPVTVPNLPYGAECTITEDGSNGQTELIVDTVTIGEEPDLTTIVAVNVYELAGLELSKTVESTAVDENGDPVPFGPFEAEVACTFLGEPVVAEGYELPGPMVVELEDGADPVALTGLPAGAECTITETQTAGAASTSITVTQDGEDPVVTDGTSTTVVLTPNTLPGGEPSTDVAVENTFAVGMLDLLKVVDGEGAEQWGAGPFTIAVQCTFDDDGDGPLEPRVVYDSTVTLGGAGPLDAEIANLPTGAVCTIAEEDDGGATGAVVVPDTVTIGDGEGVQVVITNTFDVGTIQVDKALDGLGALYGPGPFEVTLACTYEDVALTIPGGAARTFHPGEPAVYEGLPVGSECTVTETDDFGATEVSMSVDGGDPVDGNAVDVTVPPADDGAPTTATVTVTNTFLTSPLLIEKVVDGDGADFAPPMPEIPPLPELPAEPVTPEELAALIAQLEDFYAQFPVENVPYQASLVCTFQGQEIPIPGGPTRPFGPGLPGVYFGLPDGASCTVTETETGSTTSVTVAPDPVVIEETELPAAPLVVTVTNTYDVGSIVVEKVVDGGGAAFVTAPFEVSLACTFAGEPIEVPGGPTREVRPGSPATYDGLPVGAECVVTETDDADAAGTSISTTVEGGAPGEVVVPAADADPATITVTNTFDAGSVVVDKVVAGAGAVTATGPFAVTIGCTFQGETVDIPGGATRGFSPGEPAVYDGLPVGAACDVVESDDGGAASVEITTTIDDGDPGQLFVPTADDGPARITVTNTFDPGLPPTGTDSAWMLLLAGVFVSLGVVAVARRRLVQ